ncbi:Tim44/TimA family putative adaptor protein [Wolbachia endosymbiont of Pentidionis agamae]|uniref:Tim44/TimA family putative adaptor protein n=1 Tax=Wolbachia endosymbiont of Pentidionis agamae TaxID=3110435 RepID=UPI002FD579B8
MIEFAIYALVAALILSRLYNSLGKSQNPSLRKMHAVIEDVKVNKEKEESLSDNIDDYTNSYNRSNIKDVLYQVLKKDKNLSIAYFIKGSSKVFELIIKHFSDGNIEQIKDLMVKNLYNDLTKKLKVLQESGDNKKSIIVSIISQKIIEIKLVKNLAYIAVHFLSEQINFTQDKQGNVTLGSKSKINKVEDIWQFQKNIGSADQKWLLVSINYPNPQATVCKH